MKAAKLIAYGALGIIAGLLIENKSLRVCRMLELKASALKRRMKEKCAKKSTAN